MLEQQNSEYTGQSVAWQRPQQYDAAQPEALPSIARVRRFRREQEIYSQEDRSDTWYRMVSGAARKYIIHASGRRQIVDIHLPGDFFGFTSHNRHRFGVQSVIDGTSIECYPRQRLEALADASPALAREIRMRGFEAIERLQEQLLIVGTMTAKEKVRAFLIYFCERISTAQDEGVALPISRYDMADLLGISVETVCRVFTELQQRGAISMQGPRRVRLTRRVDRS
ncbi:helix-turn-helix domain-containing protein [Mesorhizobium sp. AR10]|uniref:helix-turn-helix domain-containing protein n=1 Tax=Mesorhizobium sp. AR10 TaxID=2865839 RepID=UPI002160926D|nr:helix-turn-helix domain-containing protein [Mesorhizobium sp. AR10]UVK41020.1 helix-turn-helix domain-containing protein [Mesorhizobium sp. AR10]